MMSEKIDSPQHKAKAFDVFGYEGGEKVVYELVRDALTDPLQLGLPVLASRQVVLAESLFVSICAELKFL